MNNYTDNKRHQKRFNIPVIGHFSNRSVRFNSIVEAEKYTNISYTLIYEACVGKIYKARNLKMVYTISGTKHIIFVPGLNSQKRQISDASENANSSRKEQKVDCTYLSTLNPRRLSLFISSSLTFEVFIV